MKAATNTAKILRSVPLPDEVAITHTNAAVLDMGSHYTRVGFAGDNAPRMRQRTAAIRSTGAPSSGPENANATGGYTGEDKDTVDLSDYCFDNAHNLYLSGRMTEEQQRATVMEHGCVSDWEAWEQLIQSVDDILLASRTELNTPLLLTEKALVPTSQRQRMAEVLYEKHRIDAVSFALSPVLALYAAGICTGVSVELGHEQSHVVPVFQGYALFHAMHCLDFGGSHLTSLLADTSAARLPAATTNPRGAQDIWAYLKECHGATAESQAAFNQLFSGSPHKDTSVQHQLPDGTVLELGPECFSGAEAYFSPTLIPRMREAPDQAAVSDEVQLRTTGVGGQAPLGIHQLVEQSIRRCDDDLTSIFYDNIVLSGGSSLFPGLPERLEAEVQALLPPSVADRARVTADVERRDAAFVGGSILASLPTFQDLWVTRAEYDEVGSMAVVRGCY